MANLGNTIINGILRVNGKINVGESITAPSFIGDLTGTASGNIKALSVSGKTITYTKGDGTTGTITTQDTTYTFTNGLSNSSGTVSNSGVRSIATGGTNGTISVNTNGTSAEVAVKGLAAAAYKGTVSSIDTSDSLPTSNAVKTFVEGKGYLTSDTKVKVNATAPNSETSYYPIWYTATSGTGEVNANDGMRYNTLQGTTGAQGVGKLILGNASAAGTVGNKYGLLALYSSSTSFGQIKQNDTTSVVNHYLPATGGTLLSTGTTSFTQTLSSGTEIGTIKINGTDTKLYSPTYTFATGDNNGTIKVTPSNGTAINIAVKGLGSNAYTSTEFTQASILPNNSGEIKTKYRISQKATTGGSTTYWYYPLCKLPVNNDWNYASAIISGRIGGWGGNNMSSITALVWNRGGEGIALLDIAGTATTMGNIWNTCNIVVYKNTDNSSTVYLKCASYFTFDLDLELFQSAASILYDGTYLTATPSGTLSAQADTSTKRAELYNGKLYVAGKEVFTTNGGTITGALNFSGNDSRIITWNDGVVQQRIRTVDNSTTNDSVFEFQQSIDSGSNWTNLATIKDNGEVVATKFTGTLDGNASTATKLSSAKTISLTGDVTGSTSFDGSANASITTTVADDSHNHTATTLPVVTNINKTTKTTTNTTIGWFTIAKTPVNNEFWSCRLLVEVKASTSQWQTYELDLVGYGNGAPTARLMERTVGTAMISQFRVFYPKAINNGYGAGIDIYSNVTTSKNIKVTLLQSENVELTDITSSILNSTYHNSSSMNGGGSGVYSIQGYTQGWIDSAGITTSVRNEQLFTAGEAIATNDIVALGIDGKYYKVTNTTASFDARTCLSGRSEANYAADAATYVRQLYSFTPLAAYTTNNDGMVANKSVYVEGTLTNDGVFKSNGKVTCTLTNGKSYMRLGIAISTTVLYMDKNVYCFSLDEDGFLTNYNGFGIGAVRSVDSGETCDLDIE